MNEHVVKISDGWSELENVVRADTLPAALLLTTLHVDTHRHMLCAHMYVYVLTQRIEPRINQTQQANCIVWCSLKNIKRCLKRCTELAISERSIYNTQWDGA